MKKVSIVKPSPVGRTENEPFGIQKKPLDYLQPSYLTPKRMSSYGYQYKLAIETNARSFLNIGSPNSVLKHLLELQNLHVIDLDIDYNTKPDVNAALPHLPFFNKSIEVVMCFQVLEHMPFDMLASSLLELKRVTEKFILLSLPDRTTTKREKIKYQVYKIFKHPFEWDKYKPIPIDPEHFWEIGQGNITESMVLEVIRQNHLNVSSHFRNVLSLYHHFFVIKL